MKIKETHIVPAVSYKMRLQEYAFSIFPSLPTKSSLKKAVKKKLILLDGRPAETSDWIKQGQKLELLEAENPVKKVFNLKLEILFEDDFLAVVNKPAGIPTSGNYFKTIENALPFNLKKTTAIDALHTPLPVHRLDNPTSGLLLIAKTKLVQVDLNRLFEEKNIRKSYHTLVFGSLLNSFILDDPIDNKEAETKIEILEQFQFKGENFTLIKAFPQTGRTHQIRIHLAGNGNPILGDKLYGATSAIRKKEGLFLAATGLEFKHPITKKNMNFKLPLPNKFKDIQNT